VLNCPLSITRQHPAPDRSNHSLLTDLKACLGRKLEQTDERMSSRRIRRLARAALDYAQHVKHSQTPTRREAGIAADAVLQLENLLRRLDESE
jgi:lauroyl/myristoyl acyltransferase